MKTIYSNMNNQTGQFSLGSFKLVNESQIFVQLNRQIVFNIRITQRNVIKIVPHKRCRDNSFGLMYFQSV